MTLLEYLRDVLVTDDEVSQIAGNRVFASNASQIASDPYLVLTQVYGSAEDAVSCGMLNFEVATIQLEAYSYDQGKSYNLWKKSREALQPFQRGYTTDLEIRGIAQSSGVSIDAITPEDASDLHLYRTRQDFDISYTYQ